MFSCLFSLICIVFCVYFCDLYSVFSLLSAFSFSTLMLLFGSLTFKTVSRMTYTVLVETLNPSHSHSCKLRYERRVPTSVTWGGVATRRPLECTVTTKQSQHGVACVIGARGRAPSSKSREMPGAPLSIPCCSHHPRFAAPS